MLTCLKPALSILVSALLVVAGAAASEIATHTAAAGASTGSNNTNTSIEARNAEPEVVSTSPSAGSTFGGTPVTLTGSGFTGATAVQFGGVSASNFTVLNDSEVSVSPPAHAPGTVDVSVTTPDGIGVLHNGYNFRAMPFVSAISTNEGPTIGGTTVIVSGTGFDGVTAVTFGDAPGTDLVVMSRTEITVTTPAHSAGAVDVKINSPGGTATLVNAFTYVAVVPSLSVEYPEVPRGGTQKIVGAGFQPGRIVTVFINPNDARPLQVTDNGSLVFSWVLPADSALGRHEITVVISESERVTATFSVVAGGGVPPSHGGGNDEHETRGATATLAHTGLDISGLIFGGLFPLLAGLVIAVISTLVRNNRRRSV